MFRISNTEILFILNPNSGRKKINNVLRQIKKIDRRIAFVVTDNLDDVEAVFTNEIEKYRVFVIVGGDGSVNQAVKYLQGRADKFLAVYPTGSGNGFALEMGFRKNIKHLLNAIHQGETVTVDLLEINSQLCINTAGVGFDSFVAHAFSKTKKRGFWNYALLSFRSIFTFKPFNASVKIGDKEHHGRYQMITIANTRQFGNNAFIAPMAKPDDGLYDVVLVKPFPAYYFPFFAIRVMLGNLRNSRHLEYFTTRETSIITTDYKEIHIDGEPLEITDGMNVSIKPGRLTAIKTGSRK